MKVELHNPNRDKSVTVELPDLGSFQLAPRGRETTDQMPINATYLKGCGIRILPVREAVVAVAAVAVAAVEEIMEAPEKAPDRPFKTSSKSRGRGGK